VEPANTGFFYPQIKIMDFSTICQNLSGMSSRLGSLVILRPVLLLVQRARNIRHGRGRGMYSQCLVNIKARIFQFIHSVTNCLHTTAFGYSRSR
jgi:hypothetical protein